jgi:hypothetical protein
MVRVFSGAEAVVFSAFSIAAIAALSALLSGAIVI